MTKAEFLKQQTLDAIELFEEHGICPPTFAILFEDGSTKSIGTSFNGIESKDAFDSVMQKICENPRVIASIFTSAGWTSKIALEQNKRPSECSDRETIITLVYNTRDNDHLVQIYKPGENAKLQLIISDSSFSGRFSNPFNSDRTMTETEKEGTINKFQENIQDSLCRAFEKFHLIVPIVFFLSLSDEQVEVKRFSEEEWKDRKWLARMLRTRCQDPKSLAFMLAFPDNDETVKMIFVSSVIKKSYCYKESPMTQTLEIESQEIYDGEFSEFFEREQK